ncbi:MAG: hypothetical protein WAT12_13680 [Candidatus Nitrotoga sp.]
MSRYRRAMAAGSSYSLRWALTGSSHVGGQGVAHYLATAILETPNP